MPWVCQILRVNSMYFKGSLFFTCLFSPNSFRFRPTSQHNIRLIQLISTNPSFAAADIYCWDCLVVLSNFFLSFWGTPNLLTRRNEWSFPPLKSNTLHLRSSCSTLSTFLHLSLLSSSSFGQSLFLSLPSSFCFSFSHRGTWYVDCGSLRDWDRQRRGGEGRCIWSGRMFCYCDKLGSESCSDRSRIKTLEFLIFGSKKGWSILWLKLLSSCNCYGWFLPVSAFTPCLLLLADLVL